MFRISPSAHKRSNLYEKGIYITINQLINQSISQSSSYVMKPKLKRLSLVIKIFVKLKHANIFELCKIPD